MDNEKILIVRPTLGDFSKFIELAKEVWDSKNLTNQGKMVQSLENQLIKKFNIPYLSLVSNGTVALEIAIKALNLPKGSTIITSPFTWIATASSIVWNNHKVKFVDIDPETLNINPELIEDAIDETVSCIIGVHVFSNPCDVESIEKIAKKYSIRVLYDGAHAIGVKLNNIDLSLYGDISIQSYHATKLFNCGEGGAIITKDSELNDRVVRLRYFGHNQDREIIHEGTNGKMHEISACIGLANIDLIDQSIKKRKKIQSLYKDFLSGLPVKFQKINKDSYNYTYLPVIFETEEVLLKVMSSLELIDVYPRRYFYPSLNSLDIFEGECPVSESISKRILCLPCYNDLSNKVIYDICKVIVDVISKN